LKTMRPLMLGKRIPWEDQAVFDSDNEELN